jgi:outer membrane protein OmpA-like peptidoglycan-associated protein
MKSVFLISLLFQSGIYLHAQYGVFNKIKNKTEEKTINKIDEKNNSNNEENNADEQVSSESVEPYPQPPATNNPTPANAPASIKSYSKYDFVPGEKIIGFEDFMTGSIGDFPEGWNTTSSAEIVTVEGKPGRWLLITKPGSFLPEFTDKYPDDFTFEFDLLHGIPFGGSSFHFVMAEMNDITMLQGWNTNPNIFKLGLNITSSNQKEGTTSTELRKNSVSVSANQVYTELLSDKYNPVHVSIWRQKERVRVYINQEKFWDIPKALAAAAKLNAIFFSILFVDANISHYIGNLRLAVGAPDTRNKFVTEGKWVTHGILFDVNSANIKPESYGSLKEMSNVLKENPDLKVQIVGHTDADGSDVANLELSKKRSASVKTALAKEFGIDESRMETDGKGEGEPIDKNDNPAGKANNRRVEFVKI